MPTRRLSMPQLLSKSTVGVSTPRLLLSSSFGSQWLTHYRYNTRFQNREYAPIEVVLTEKKGYGIRAAGDITKWAHPFQRYTFTDIHGLCPLQRDDMIYEYIGDIVSHPSFTKRMREYAEEGIRHFYFMMLQKDEVNLLFSPISCPSLFYPPDSISMQPSEAA